jgi:hypothetical protein
MWGKIAILPAQQGNDALAKEAQEWNLALQKAYALAFADLILIGLPLLVESWP